MTIELPPEAEVRLLAEAVRRGMTVGQVVAEFAARLPADAPTHRLSFVANGASGRTEPIDVKQERIDLAANKLAEGD